MALRPSPSLTFIPVSIGEGAKKIAGGSTVVAKWVNKLDAEPLDKTFFGIIDRDSGNVSSGKIFAIGRYSFENYLLDPLTLFALLVEEGTAPSVQAVNITSGDEHLLRVRDDTSLQAIADAVCAQMEATEPSLANSRRATVRYTTGAVITVPAWVIDHRGHDLLPIAQRAFGGPQLVTPPRLMKALRRCRLIPEELAKLLAEIQAS